MAGYGAAELEAAVTGIRVLVKSINRIVCFLHRRASGSRHVVDGRGQHDFVGQLQFVRRYLLTVLSASGAERGSVVAVRRLSGSGIGRAQRAHVCGPRARKLSH